MAKEKAPAEKVSVVLKCIYSADEQYYPGDIVEVAADEAERLVSIGAAILAANGA